MRTEIPVLIALLLLLELALLNVQAKAPATMQNNAVEEQTHAEIKHHNYIQALKLCDEWVASGHSTDKALNQRARIYEKIGLYENALADVNKAIQINSKDATFYDERGSIYCKMHDCNKAIANWKQGLAILKEAANPAEDAWEHNHIGYILANQGNNAAAIKEYNLAIKSSTDKIDSIYLRGCALQDMGRLKDALQDFLSVSKLDRCLKAPQQRAAIIYEKLDLSAEAKNMWKLVSVTLPGCVPKTDPDLLIPWQLSAEEITNLRGEIKAPE